MVPVLLLSLPTNHQPPTTTSNSRSGISLLEVLISIFVLAVGLLGVAAMIPAGRYQIGQGTRIDYTAMVGRAALRDMKVRGYTTLDKNPGRTWLEIGGQAAWRSTNNDFLQFDGSFAPRVAVVMDPLGIAANFPKQFPDDAPTALPFLHRIAPADPTNLAMPEEYDLVFRSSLDLLTQENTTNRDLPPQQVFLAADKRRASQGDYSWMATIVSDPTANALASEVTVSVAVFHKRNLSPLSDAAADRRERWANVQAGPPFAGLIGGGLLELIGLPTDFPLVKPGQWIMLTGRRNPPNPPDSYFAWYRVLSAGPLVSGSTQRITVAGRDWDRTINQSLRVFIIDSVVAVYEKNMRLTIE